MFLVEKETERIDNNPMKSQIIIFKDLGLEWHLPQDRQLLIVESCFPEKSQDRQDTENNITDPVLKNPLSQLFLF